MIATPTIGGFAMTPTGVGRMGVFGKERDFEAFEEVIGQAKRGNWGIPGTQYQY